MDKMMALNTKFDMGPKDFEFIMQSVPGEMDAANEFEWLKDISKYIYHVHAKCLCMAPDGSEDEKIDTIGAVRALKAIGYDGYLSTEYEGQRDTHAQGSTVEADEIGQVKLHQAMLRRLIAE
jgi:hypothetical protein